MLQSGFMSVLQAQSQDELRLEIVRFANDLGFDKVSATTIIDHVLAPPEFIVIDNTPAAYRATFENMSMARADPVSQHCKRGSIPIIWDQQTYVTNGQGDKWEAQAAFGYSNGIALALHLPGGKHFFVGVDRDQPVPKHKGELTRVVADLQLFAVMAQESAFRLFMPSSVHPDAPALTPRELECLRWTMEGKTAWEIGAILGITERTVVLHVNGAMHKLDSVNKHQAVLKALRLGLIR
jgi:DNA-binding CsgD family transcriptional regulator